MYGIPWSIAESRAPATTSLKRAHLEALMGELLKFKTLLFDIGLGEGEGFAWQAMTVPLKLRDWPGERMMSAYEAELTTMVPRADIRTRLTH